MKYAIGMLAFVLAALPARAQFDDLQPGRPVRFDDVVTKLEAEFEPKTAKRGETVTWKLTVEILPGWHTYPSRQADPNASAQVTKIKIPKSSDFIPTGAIKEPLNPISKAEPDLGIKELHQYEGLLVWELKLVVSPTATPGTKTLKVPVTLIVCKESCLPPTTRDVSATLTIVDSGEGIKSPQQPTAAANSIPIVPSTYVDPDEAPIIKGADHEAALTAVLKQITKQKVEPNTGLWPFLVTAAFWGMVTLFTPCVFPMIPITVSFFLKQAEKNQSSALLLAFVYCGTIVVVLGTAALTLLGFFTKLSVSPAMNLFLGLLFVALALSLFGMFDLTLPSFLTRFTASREGQGGVIGTVFMALTFTVVSFTCVAPFLGGFGGMAASGQFQTWELVLGAVAFAGTFAAPFFFLALFPALLKKLPKSGGWLNTVKVVMGFLELAAALKFLRTAELIAYPEVTFFTFDLVLGMWIALALLCGLYLINVFRLGHDEVLETVSVPRFLLGFVFISIGFYLVPAMFANGPDGEKQRPRGSVYAWIDSFLLPDASGNAKAAGLDWSGDLKTALDQASSEAAQTGKAKYVFVDFTGESCTNCKLNEESVFRKNEIQDLFKPFKLVQMYTDKVPDKFYSTAIRSKFKGSTARQRGDAELNRWFQDKAFGIVQLPLYVILKPTPEGPIEVVDVYPEGKISNVGAFAEFLKKPFVADTSRAQSK